jgi:DNA repair protein RecO (recombination protein O)
MRLMSIIGFRPQIEECCICKTKEKLGCFSIREYGFKCKACAKQDGSTIEITETTKDAIIYIILADAKKIYSFTVPERTQKELEIISKLYLTECLEKDYK